MISVEVSRPSLSAALTKWRNRVYGDLLNRAAQRVAEQTRNRVRTEKSSPDGVRWAKRKDNEKHPLMQKTRKLERSIKASRLSRQLVKVDSPVGYDKFHQSGTPRMVARKIYGLSTKNIRDLDGLIKAWVRRLT